jgi:mono/diheme cytochrome c family protein
MASILLAPVRSFCSALILLAVANLAAADEINFELQIRPLLTKHCGSCHGAETQKSGLRLDAKSFAFRGGDGGPVINPGKPESSSLIERITSDDPGLRMPPEGPALPASDIGLLRRWIANGAVWPETDYDRSAIVDDRLQHWAWQPIKVTEPPANVASSTTHNAAITEIDRFILAELSKHQLDLSEPADRRTLIRRLSFDLLGLPPTPEQVQAFVADPDPRAYEKLLDTFLASPHYGERWARHWLDIAHYADTHGFERDQRRDNAWPYRDWVIRAINNDMPYDQFLRDQIAGDALRPTDPDAVIATGFLAAGPWDFVGQAETPSPVLKRLARADDLDQVGTKDQCLGQRGTDVDSLQWSGRPSDET